MRHTAVIVLGVVLLVGCGGKDSPADAKTFEAQGSLLLRQPVTRAMTMGEPCSGSDAFSDIDAGTAVVVRDGKGKKVAAGKLGAGKLDTDNKWCKFAFTVGDIPGSDGLYTIEVAQLGEVSFKRADAQAIEMAFG